MAEATSTDGRNCMELHDWNMTFFLGAWARRGRKLIAIKQERDLQDHILTNSSKEMGKYSRKLQIFYLSWAFPISIHFHLAESVLRGAKINLSRGVVA